MEPEQLCVGDELEPGDRVLGVFALGVALDVGSRNPKVSSGERGNRVNESLLALELVFDATEGRDAIGLLNLLYLGSGLVRGGGLGARSRAGRRGLGRSFGSSFCCGLFDCRGGGNSSAAKPSHTNSLSI